MLFYARPTRAVLPRRTSASLSWQPRRVPVAVWASLPSEIPSGARKALLFPDRGVTCGRCTFAALWPCSPCPGMGEGEAAPGDNMQGWPDPIDGSLTAHAPGARRGHHAPSSSRTGQGQLIEIAQLEATASTMEVAC
jgi:hypothetical protein